MHPLRVLYTVAPVFSTKQKYLPHYVTKSDLRNLPLLDLSNALHRYWYSFKSNQRWFIKIRLLICFVLFYLRNKENVASD